MQGRSGLRKRSVSPAAAPGTHLMAGLAKVAAAPATTRCGFGYAQAPSPLSGAFTPQAQPAPIGPPPHHSKLPRRRTLAQHPDPGSADARRREGERQDAARRRAKGTEHPARRQPFVVCLGVLHEDTATICNRYRYKALSMTRTNTKSRAALAPIGRMSERTGVHIETIRYYERIGLLPEPLRSEGRHRLYDDNHRQRLVFIRRSRELGFSLDQIRGLLGLSKGSKFTCSEVKALTEQHIADIRHKIRDLKRLARILSDLSARCRGGKLPTCPILDVLGSVS